MFFKHIRELPINKMIRSPSEFILKAYTILSVFSLFFHASMVLQFLGCLVKRKIILKFLLASLKTLPNSKDCSESRILISVPAFLLTGSFSPVYIMCPTFETIFRITGDFSEQLTELKAAIRQPEQAS
jgi:hypothetical protein